VTAAQLTATNGRRHEEPERGNALAELVPIARTLDRTPDVIDELVEAVIDEGGSIQHVRTEARP
jgi:hypothetical protein